MKNDLGRINGGKSEDAPQMGKTEPYEKLASEIARVFAEGSPRLSTRTQARQLEQLRTLARQKHGARSWKPQSLLTAVPRLLQVAAIAIVVALVFNGITIASASSLPGSLLYPVKRFAEQSNLLFSPSSGERARLWMNFAGIRLDEAQRLLASGQRVDPAILDAVDDSILHALLEIAGTRGADRLALLEQITQLSEREQGILDALAESAAPDERARLEQTARLLSGVASLAGAAQNNPDLPLYPTPATDTPTFTWTPTPTTAPTMTNTSTSTPRPSDTSTLAPTSTQPRPDVVPAQPDPQPPATLPGGDGKGPVPQPSETPEHDKQGTPLPQKTENPAPEKTENPGPQKGESPEPQNTERPDLQRAPTGDAHE